MTNIEQISICKFRNTVKSFEDCIKKDNNGKPFVPLLDYINIEKNGIYGLWWYSEGTSNPKTETNIPWINFMNQVLPSPITLQYANTFPKGLLLYKVKINDNDTFFAITFGLAGDKNIDKNKILPDFGIKVAMNICNPNEIKSIQTSQHEAISVQSEKQILSGAGLSDFNIDYNDEFFKKIIGKTSEKYKYISSVTGGEKIQLKFDKDKPLNWYNIKDITIELNNLYNSEQYKKTEFKCFDNWSFEKEQEKINELNNSLIEEINKLNFDKISLGVPEIIDINRYSFKYHQYEDKEYEELNIDDFLKTLRKEKASLSSLQSKNIFVYDKETESTYSKWKVYQCIVAEIIDSDNNCYILCNGRWRKIDTNFREKIIKYLENNNIEFDNTFLEEELKNNICIYDESKKQNREEIFNSHCVKENKKLFLFDKSKISIANEKKYEICDILTVNKELIHVKKYKTGASSLSHLFTQAKVYSEAIIINTDTRTTMLEFINKEVKNETSVNFQKETEPFENILQNNGRLNEKDFTVVLCILTNGNISLKDLPFMTQYEIWKMDDYLKRNRGFNVKYINRSVTMK